MDDHTIPSVRKAPRMGTDANFTMNRWRSHLAWVAALGALAMGMNAEMVRGAVKPLKPYFATKEEAEQAASQYGCEGAHQVGDRWYPCPGRKERHVTGSPDAPVGE